MTWFDAMALQNSTWRVPSKTELQSLFEPRPTHPNIDTEVFPDAPLNRQAYYWTSNKLDSCLENANRACAEVVGFNGGKLAFTYSDGSVTVLKQFDFDSSYVIHAFVSVISNDAPITAMATWPSGFGDQETQSQYTGARFNTMQNGTSVQDNYKHVLGGNTLHGPFAWAGVSDLYFAAIFLPDVPHETDVISLHNEIRIPKNRKHPDPNASERVPVLGAAVRVSCRRHVSAPLCWPKGHRHSLLNTRHIRRWETDRPEHRARHHFWLVGIHCQAALHPT